MKFGTRKLAEAEGAILAHSVKHQTGTFKKGRKLSVADLELLRAAGVEEIIAAQLDASDVPEDEAARALALAVAGEGTRAQQPFTGRANVLAKRFGLVLIDEARVHSINHLDESLTIATVPSFSRVTDKQMVATIKIIPFACPRPVLEQALQIAQTAPLMRVVPFSVQSPALIITTLPQTKPSLIAKTVDVTRGRLEAMGLPLNLIRQVPHTQSAVSAALTEMKKKGSDLILVFGASAIVDRADVIPAALTATGGTVTHLGMPVDPGNLLMLGALDDTPVIGVPSCARSPKRNGFDWVLERCCARLQITGKDIMDMGVGGLLAEISSRPTPREGRPQAAPRVAAIVLAAGKSSRMGSNKLMADFDGRPMLRVTVENVLASSVDEVVVVTGHEPDKAQAALTGLDVRIIHNPDYAKGLSTSLRAGVQALTNTDAAIICLADMPRVKPETLDRLIAAFNPIEHRSIVVPTWKGQFGNPVLWGAEHFNLLKAMTGDKGARSLIGEMKSEATEIVADEAVLLDVDTPESLASLKSTAKT